MGRSSEPITRLPDGRYRVRVDAGFHPDGRRRQVQSTHATLKEARLALARVRNEAAQGTYVGRTTVTVRRLYESWLAGKRKIKPTTRQHYTDVSALLLERLGDLPVHQLEKHHLDDLVTELLSTGGRGGHGRSVSYVRAMLIGLGQALDQAVAQRLCVTNVARLVELPEMPLPKPVTWTPAQAQAFLEHVSGSDLEALWRMTMGGMRRGEVVGLPWLLVDLSARTITIQQTRVNMHGSVITSTPKTRRGERVLPIWDSLHAALERLERFGPLVATFPNGQPILPRWYADEFKRQAHAAGLPPIPLKNARHTSVTLMRNQGIPDHIVAAWHGHDESVMRAVYTDARPYLGDVVNLL